MNFYLFGRKRIKQLEESLAVKDRLFQIQQHGWRESNEQLAAARNQVEYLVRTIRDIDQEIWNMGQKTDWNQQRPHFNKLHDEMTARKVEESKRIGSLIHGEIIETYATPKQKRLGK